MSGMWRKSRRRIVLHAICTQCRYKCTTCKTSVTTPQDAKGDWLELFVNIVKTDNDGNPEKVKLFIGPDQTPEQRAVFCMCKKIKLACSIIYPTTEFSFWKQKGIIRISVDNEKVFLAKMLPTASDVNRNMVQWDNSNVAKFNIDKVRVLDMFETLVMDPANATGWCL